MNGVRLTMNREALFRGKRTDDGQWIFGSYVQQYGTHEIYLPDGTDSEYGSDHYIVFPSTVGQYIGLTDNDGTKIFKGDILRCTDTNLDYTWTGVIKFGNPNGEYNWGWQIVPIGDVDVNTDILLWVETELPNIKCEIIGNIHDNPELLEVHNG